MKKTYLFVALLLPLSIVFYMNWFVQRSTYPAPNIRVGPPPSEMKQIAINYDNGNSAEGWLHETASKGSLLYLHGNGENLETIRHSGLLEQLQNLGLSFLVIDYPGYGNSKGKPSEQSLTKSAIASLEFLSKRFSNQKIVICGWSLGASVAILSASKFPDLDGLIAISAWTRLEDVAALHFPSVMVKALPPEKYDSLNAAKSVRCPAIMIHGEQDNLIPAEQGKRVSANLTNLKQWLLVPEAGHNDLLDHPEVWQSIEKFIVSLDVR